MRYLINFSVSSNCWEVRELRSSNSFRDSVSGVSCNWTKNEKTRSYNIAVYADSAGEALEKGKSEILLFIENHKNPFCLINEVINIPEKLCVSYEEIIHDLCRAIVDLKEKINSGKTE